MFLQKKTLKENENKRIEFKINVDVKFLTSTFTMNEFT